MHIVVIPVIAEGSGLTVICVNRAQPVLVSVYEIVPNPVARPVTAPLASTDSVEGALELHVPPLVASDRVLTPAGHTFILPVITSGSGFTVTVVVL
jgi:hypothetical protein